MLYTINVYNITTLQVDVVRFHAFIANLHCLAHLGRGCAIQVSRPSGAA
jgi:hypothetical protein